MAETDGRGITTTLAAIQQGDRSAVDRLFDQVYPELVRLARQVRHGRAGETLDTTALAHEAYLKLAAGTPLAVQDRAHFLAVAARAMRQVLIDAARRRVAAKRGGRAWQVTLDPEAMAAPVRPDRLLALDAALERLARSDPRKARVVEQRIFAGLTTAESAAVLGISTATVEREWRAARAWLAVELDGAKD